MPTVNVILPMHGIPPVTADQLFARDRPATGLEQSDSDARLDCLAQAVRLQWRVIANARDDGSLEEVEFVKWFAQLDEATEALFALNPPADRRFYIRTTDDESSNVITNVHEGPSDFLHDADSPAGDVRRP
jgi:hypothetical protein